MLSRYCDIVGDGWLHGFTLWLYGYWPMRRTGEAGVWTDAQNQYSRRVG